MLLIPDKQTASLANHYGWNIETALIYQGVFSQYRLPDFYPDTEPDLSELTIFLQEYCENENIIDGNQTEINSQIQWKKLAELIMEYK